MSILNVFVLISCMANYMLPIIIQNSNRIVQDITQISAFLEIFEFNNKRRLSYKLWHSFYVIRLLLGHFWSDERRFFIKFDFLFQYIDCLMPMILDALHGIISSKLRPMMSCMFSICYGIFRLLFDLFQ